MRERLRFRSISKVKLVEEEETDAKKQLKSEKEKEKSYVEFTVYDLLLEKSEIFPMKLKILSTEVNKSQTISVLEVQTFFEKPKTVDISLVSYKLKEMPATITTEIPKEMQKSLSRSVDVVSHFDLQLELKTTLKDQLNKGLNTDISMTTTETSIESLHVAEEVRLPIFEEFIECDGRFPRSFSESFNSPFVILVGEDECEWHIPIIYSLKELFREITDKYPRITFREPEIVEEGLEEHVDSLDPHSLDQFTFEYKIEFLDTRKMHLAVDEFAKIVKGRLNSAFLQQFGILIVAVKKKDMEKAKKVLEIGGIRVYKCEPDDSKYEQFSSKVLGVSLLGEFFKNFMIYERNLGQTVRRFSIFVKRGLEATDKLQYPLKVATFVYLLNDLRRRKKKLIKNFDELCKFAKEVINKEEIKIEEEKPIGDKKVIPDIIYSPEGGEEIFIEIETLVGTFEPMKKIDETIEKYKDFGKAKIWIVLRPISALLHYEELKSRKRAYKLLYEDKEIEFKVLTLLISKDKLKWEVVSLDEFLKGAKNVK